MFQTLPCATLPFYRLISRMRRGGWYMWFARPVFRFKSAIRYARARNKRFSFERAYLKELRRNTLPDKPLT